MSELISSYTTLNTWSYAIGGRLIGMTMPITAAYTKIDYVTVPLIRVGTVSGNVTISIYATSGGVPTGSALGSATLAASSIATSGTTYYTFNFSTDVTVTPGTYAIVKADGSSSSSAYIGWRRSTNPDYASGQGYFYDGSWSDWSRDFGFRTYGYGPPWQVGITTASSVTNTSMTAGCDVTDDSGATITERGFVYSTTDSTPTIAEGATKVTAGSGTGAFSASLTGLTPDTTYYVRGYCTNAAGTEYGSVKTQATTSVVPTVTTQACSAVSFTTATGNGTVTNAQGSTVTRRGFCYVEGTSGDPTTADSTAYDDGSFSTGVFSKGITGLTAGTGYRVRAYAVNSEGTGYGTTVQLTTSSADAPEVTTTATSLLRKDTAIVGGNVTDEGTNSVTERGIYYGTTEETQATKMANGSGEGTFPVFMSGLDKDTTYYYKAFATSSIDTSYGDVLHFTTGNEPTEQGTYGLPPFAN